MDKAVAAAYRRRGFAVFRKNLASSLTPKRIVITAGFSLLVALVFLAAVYVPAWQVGDEDSTSLVGPVTVALVLATVWATFSTWLRHDRPTTPPLSYFESGELARVTREDGTLDIPGDRRETVAKVVLHEVPRTVGRAFHQAAFAAFGMLFFAFGLLLLAAGGRFFIGSLVIGVQALVSAATLWHALAVLGQYDEAGELANAGGIRPPAAR